MFSVQKNMTSEKTLVGLDLVQKGNVIQATMCIADNHDYVDGIYSKIGPEYTFSYLAKLQVRVITTKHKSNYKNLIFFKFMKMNDDDDMLYTFILTSQVLKIVERCYTSDEGTWHLVHETNVNEISFDVKVQMDIVPTPVSFAVLYKDVELTDFKLRGDDGSVNFHRAVLAITSPVFKRMFNSTWLEATEGHVEVPGTSQLTLEHLKDYLYLHILPDTGLDNLILLASYYMMPILELKCVHKLVHSMTAESACDLLEFATKNKMSKLLVAVLTCVRDGSVEMAGMRDYIFRAA